MEINSTPFPGLLVIQAKVFSDERGYFYEAFSAERYKEICGVAQFVQDNISCSVQNTVRGLHYQAGEFAQGKLCNVLYGKVLDVAVDIRFGSPTFGKHFAVELSDENHKQLWIPPGFAHGFSVLSDEAIFHYKCTAYYSKESERTILFSDSALNIDWKVKKPIVSTKDLAGAQFSNIHKDFTFE
jgi:dTDP-4-dehydrorhamnose 3,5-epimerase